MMSFVLYLTEIIRLIFLCTICFAYGIKLSVRIEMLKLQKRILYMKNIIMQLIAMQSYTNLKLVFLLNDKTSLDFQFAKMLPHVWDDRHEIRFFGDNEKDIKDISDYLGKEIHERKNQDDGRCGTGVQTRSDRHRDWHVGLWRLPFRSCCR